MKKRIIACVLSLSIVFGLSACGETAKNSYGEEVQKFGSYIEISHTSGKDDGGRHLTFYKVYNTETKEMFEIIDGYDSVCIRQIWDYDEEGHPIVKYYKGE